MKVFVAHLLSLCSFCNLVGLPPDAAACGVDAAACRFDAAGCRFHAAGCGVRSDTKSILSDTLINVMAM